MGIRPNISVTMPSGIGTYQIYYGDSKPGYENYAEMHFFPAIGAEIEWYFLVETTVQYSGGRTPSHYVSLDRWNGFTWMVQDEKCPLCENFVVGAASYITSANIKVTLYGSPNSVTYQKHGLNGGTGDVDWLFRCTTYKWESSWDSQAQVTRYTKTSEITDRDIWCQASSSHPYYIGQRENYEYGGSMYGPWLSAIWNDTSISPDTYTPWSVCEAHRDCMIRDYQYSGGSDYTKKHNMVHLYWWRPWLFVSCDYEYNARYDEPYDYDLVHYPGATPPTCSPAGLLSVYLDLSTYQHLSPGGGLPTPSWPGHELCVNTNFPGATWFDRSNITATRAKGIYELCNLTSQSDHMLYCAWKNLSCEVDVYCYSPSNSQYIDFRSGDYPAHNPDPATGASVYKYGSYSKLILSGPVGTNGWHYKYLCENGRRQYFYVYGSTSQGQYKYLSAGTDNGHSFRSKVTPYDNEEYWFYTDGYDHRIVFNFKKNGTAFTYLPMYYPSSRTLIRGVRNNLLIRDGDA